MALKALMLRKKIDLKKKERSALEEQRKKLLTREAELEKAINEVTNEEEEKAVQEDVDKLTQEKDELTKQENGLDETIKQLETELAETEAAQDTTPPTSEPTPAAESGERSNKKMNHSVTRTKFFGMTMEQRDAFFAREDVKNYLGEIRTCIKEKRAVTNVGLTIPQVMLPLLKENIENYSKLYKYVTVRPLNGIARMNIMGNVPEAIWMECCAVLNELDIGFNDMEADCFMVGGFFAICNANLEDSDVDLASEFLTALSQAIGIALDKAILYGRNTSAHMKMPLGIVSRLAQTEQPSGYSPTARTWVDLHSTNIITITAAKSKGADLMVSIVEASAAMKNKYSVGGRVWCMNETTHVKVMASTITTTAAGQFAAGITDTMPLLGGPIEELSFIPDNVIIGGYFDLYMLFERAGKQFASSEHVRFLQNQTVFKGIARYDGAPAIPEGFIVIGINGTTPTAAMDFPPDTANASASTGG